MKFCSKLLSDRRSISNLLTVTVFRQKKHGGSQIFREYYETKGILENEMYEGMDGVLQKLKEQGKFLMVATSKPEKFAHNILAQHDLEKYFDFIGGSLTDGSRITKFRYWITY